MYAWRSIVSSDLETSLLSSAFDLALSCADVSTAAVARVSPCLIVRIVDEQAHTGGGLGGVGCLRLDVAILLPPVSPRGSAPRLEVRRSRVRTGLSNEEDLAWTAMCGVMGMVTWILDEDDMAIKGVTRS